MTIEDTLRRFRSWYRRRYSPYAPARLMPSIGWAHTRSCIGGVSYDQAMREERAWAQGTTDRWLAGDKM